MVTINSTKKKCGTKAHKKWTILILMVRVLQ